ncbi:unnamed protein product [Oppiella nova]|uniref:TIR domain-containing protein n=1 Tax=Oppiella nova TaxID=334625 RepID=A0A7R9LMH9_9ACAR|nr:unnamed protein product [Oppiella nova]CAG2164719.1 unnamed protein product [Oppiella nova]
MLDRIERYDIIDDMTPFLREDSRHYKSVKPSNDSSEPNHQMMAIEPKIIIYDAYVCYADKDIGFVEQLSQYLESPNVGLRLFIRDRDLCLGSWAYESFAQMVTSQCRKVLIILSPDFLECPECDFQTAFTTGLAIEQRNRILIPIIHKRCDLPPIIRMLTKIDMTRSLDTPDWTWNRLVNSIRIHSANQSFVTKSVAYESKPTLLQLPSVPSDSPNGSQLISIETISDSCISLPTRCPTPTAPPLIITQSSVCSTNSEMSIKSDNSECLPILSTEKDKNSKKLIHKTWYQSLRQKFKS